MKLGRRSIIKVLGAVSEPCHYRALMNMVRTYPDFGENLVRYLRGSGSYPYRCRIRTPLGEVAPTLHSFHDLLTVNEIFCREDYPAGSRERVIVDVGSNIGISALYFLTRNEDAVCYLFEPDPRNIPRLHENLRDFAGRYVLEDSAVGPEEGWFDFGVEPSGRYGGIGAATQRSIKVRCRSIDSVLAQVVDAEGSIDILKIDTEGLEPATVRAIDLSLLERIRAIYYEAPRGDACSLPGFTHRYRCETHRLMR